MLRPRYLILIAAVVGLLIAEFMGCLQLSYSIHQGRSDQLSGVVLESNSVDAFIVVTDQTLGDVETHLMKLGDFDFLMRFTRAPLVLNGVEYDLTQGTVFFVTFPNGQCTVEQVKQTKEKSELMSLLERIRKGATFDELRG